MVLRIPLPWLSSSFSFNSRSIFLQTCIILTLFSVVHLESPNEEVTKVIGKRNADLPISVFDIHNYKRRLNKIKASSQPDYDYDHYYGETEEFDEYQSTDFKLYKGRKAKPKKSTKPEDVYDEFVKGVKNGGPEIEPVNHDFEAYDPKKDKNLKIQTTKAPKKAAKNSKVKSRWTASNCQNNADSYVKHDEKDSKYFINRVQRTQFGRRNGSFQEIIDGCIGWHLVAAEIRHYDDYASLMRQYKKTKEKPLGFPMNIKDDVFGTRGDWGYSDRKKLTFSLWDHPSPDNETRRFPEGESCAIINFHLYDGAPRAMWDDVACNDQIWKNAVQVCQFPKGHVCYDKSKEEKAWKKRDKKLFKVGTIGKRTYYSSFEQKNTFKDAFQFCKASHLHLWQIPPVNTRDAFFKIHQKLLKKLDVHTSTRFWSSAYLPNPLKSIKSWKLRQLHHNATYKRHAKDWGWWTHSQGYKDLVPKAKDKCISWYVRRKPTINSSVFSLRAFPCDQPFFVYCISDPVLEIDPETGDTGFENKSYEDEDIIIEDEDIIINDEDIRIKDEDIIIEGEGTIIED